MRLSRYSKPRGFADMVHPIHRVCSVEVVGDSSLRVRFEDELERTIDFSPIMHGTLYGGLSDPDVFRQVQIDPIAKTLVWPNGADFDPATLHDWPVVVDEMKTRVEAWDQNLRNTMVAEAKSDYHTS
jgi:hypothetical protein